MIDYCDCHTSKLCVFRYFHSKNNNDAKSSSHAMISTFTFVPFVDCRYWIFFPEESFLCPKTVIIAVAFLSFTIKTSLWLWERANLNFSKCFKLSAIDTENHQNFHLTKIPNWWFSDWVQGREEPEPCVRSWFINIFLWLNNFTLPGDPGVLVTVRGGWNSVGFVSPDYCKVLLIVCNGIW